MTFQHPFNILGINNSSFMKDVKKVLDSKNTVNFFEYDKFKEIKDRKNKRTMILEYIRTVHEVMNVKMGLDANKDVIANSADTFNFLLELCKKGENGNLWRDLSKSVISKYNSIGFKNFTSKYRCKLETQACGYASIDNQCNIALGTKENPKNYGTIGTCQYCSIEFENTVGKCIFSCDHILEAGVMLLVSGLTPHNLVNKKRFENLYSWVCQRCNMIKSEVQKAKWQLDQNKCGIFVNFNGIQFEINEDAIKKFVKMYLLENVQPAIIEKCFDDGDGPANYANQIYHIATNKDEKEEMRENILNIVDNCVETLNSYIKNTGDILDRMWFFCPGIARLANSNIHFFEKASSSSARSSKRYEDEYEYDDDWLVPDDNESEEDWEGGGLDIELITSDLTDIFTKSNKLDEKYKKTKFLDSGSLEETEIDVLSQKRTKRKNNFQDNKTVKALKTADTYAIEQADLLSQAIDIVTSDFEENVSALILLCESIDMIDNRLDEFQRRFPSSAKSSVKPSLVRSQSLKLPRASRPSLRRTKSLQETDDVDWISIFDDIRGIFKDNLNDSKKSKLTEIKQHAEYINKNTIVFLTSIIEHFNRLGISNAEISNIISIHPNLQLGDYFFINTGLSGFNFGKYDKLHNVMKDIKTLDNKYNYIQAASLAGGGSFLKRKTRKNAKCARRIRKTKYFN